MFNSRDIESIPGPRIIFPEYASMLDAFDATSLESCTHCRNVLYFWWGMGHGYRYFPRTKSLLGTRRSRMAKRRLLLELELFRIRPLILRPVLDFCLVSKLLAMQPLHFSWVQMSGPINGENKVFFLFPSYLFAAYSSHTSYWGPLTINMGGQKVVEKNSSSGLLYVAMYKSLRRNLSR